MWGRRVFLDTTTYPGFITLHRGFIGDTNQDGNVDLTDLTMLASHCQQTASWNEGDFNHDRVVDLTDLTMLAGHWQSSVPFAPAFESAVFGGQPMTPVPEPATLDLLLPSLLLLGRKRS
jgi:hypothetical protein